MNKTNQINPSRPSRSAILQWHFLIILGMLVVDFPITHNGFSETY
jgi:hypothetical protein